MIQNLIVFSKLKTMFLPKEPEMKKALDWD
jgi:hypothetical protein